jgi:hypothetical protein
VQNGKGINALAETVKMLLGDQGDAIAVGKVIADLPPHRSRRALLTHRAPTSSV